MTLHLLDANVWLALAIEGHVHHSVTTAWLATIEESETILFCRSTQQSYLRLLTTAAVVRPHSSSPMTNEQAWASYAALLADQRILFEPDEPSGVERLWEQYASRTTASPKLWMDAYLAAFARAGGYRLVTTDAGFRQFRGLDLVVLGSRS